MNELQWVLDDGSEVAPAATPSIGRGRRLVLVALCAVAVLVGLAARSTLWGTTPPAATPFRLSFLRPVGALTNTGRPVLTISPDGTKIVFNANNQLYVRRLDSAESVPIPGTQGTGVQTPFFSADGRWVAFFSAETHELKRIPVEGGVAVTICQSPAEGVFVPGPNGSPAGNFGASWTADNQILFATRDGVFRVPASGGTLQKIVGLKAGEAVYGPQMLPDGDHLLLTVTTVTGADRWEKAQIIAQSLSTGARTVLIEGGADGRYLDTGHLLYAVGTTLFAVPVDVQSLRTLGAPVTIVRGVRRAAGPAAVNTAAAFAATSKTGDLVYIPDTLEAPISVSVDLSGRLTPLPDSGVRAVHVSPDGSQMLAHHADAWWIYSLTRREAPRRLTDAAGANTNPVWTPDGTRIAFRSQRESGPAIFWRRADGTGSPDMLLDLEGRPIGWSRDGKTLFYIFERSLWSWTQGEKPRSLLSIDSPYASLSPDRQWVAFHTSEHGRPIPYVQSLFNPGARFQISPDGGHAPLWSPDGRKLFFVSGERNSLMAVDVQTTPTVTFGEPVVLVPAIAQGLALEERWYDITPDGKHLLVQVPDRTDPRSREVDVVLNWFEELKRRVPAQ